MGYWGGIIGPVVLAAYLVLRSGSHAPNSWRTSEIQLGPLSHRAGLCPISRYNSPDTCRPQASVGCGPEGGADAFAPIVIFIDDLDRCSPTKIASVVEGISMLLASDTYRCMFLIGMDPQMIAAALEKAHEEIRERLPSYERQACHLAGASWTSLSSYRSRSRPRPISTNI